MLLDFFSFFFDPVTELSTGEGNELLYITAGFPRFMLRNNSDLEMNCRVLLRNSPALDYTRTPWNIPTIQPTIMLAVFCIIEALLRYECFVRYLFN